MVRIELRPWASDWNDPSLSALGLEGGHEIHLEGRKALHAVTYVFSLSLFGSI